MTGSPGAHTPNAAPGRPLHRASGAAPAAPAVPGPLEGPSGRAQDGPEGLRLLPCRSVPGGRACLLCWPGSSEPGPPCSGGRECTPSSHRVPGRGLVGRGVAGGSAKVAGVDGRLLSLSSAVEEGRGADGRSGRERSPRRAVRARGCPGRSRGVAGEDEGAARQPGLGGVPAGRRSGGLDGGRRIVQRGPPEKPPGGGPTVSRPAERTGPEERCWGGEAVQGVNVSSSLRAQSPGLGHGLVAEDVGAEGFEAGRIAEAWQDRRCPRGRASRL